MRVNDADLKALYENSRDLITGTIRRTEDGMVELIDYKVQDWKKIANYAYYFLTLGNAGRSV